MAQLSVISGVGGKFPAAFLIKVSSRRILLDLGEGPQPGQRPDPDQIGHVDAVCLTHAHVDHTGSLDMFTAIGEPDVYATAATWQQLSAYAIPEEKRHTLPLNGACTVAGVPFMIGRNGHSPGGVWLMMAREGGILYMGDWSIESRLFPFDPPPSAACLITDASYGDRSEPLSKQIQHIIDSARRGMVFPVPPNGRGPEMAICLMQAGIIPRLCPVIHSEITTLAFDTTGLIAPGMQADCRTLLSIMPEKDTFQPEDVIIATAPNAEDGLSAALLRRHNEGFRFTFTGHVPPNTPAQDLLSEGAALWLPWNAHPPIQDNLALILRTRPRFVIAAFGKPETMALFATISPVSFFWGDSLVINENHLAPTGS